MKLEIINNTLRVNLNPFEKIVSLHGSLKVPLDHITGVSTENPGWEWAVRSPGINIPFLLKAGTYRAGRGPEFWMTTAGRPYLVMNVMSWAYSRVVLKVDNSNVWAEQIRQAIR